jgi:hypothetical protein
MNPVQMILGTLVSLVFFVINGFYWWYAMSRWQDAFRRRCERRYGVTLAIQGKGYWHVVERIPWYKRFGIEMLQLGYFMAVFFGWALALGLGAGFFRLLGQLGLSFWPR